MINVNLNYLRKIENGLKVVLFFLGSIINAYGIKIISNLCSGA